MRYRNKAGFMAIHAIVVHLNSVFRLGQVFDYNLTFFGRKRVWNKIADAVCRNQRTYTDIMMFF